MALKTSNAQVEAIRRYEAKTYKRVLFELRYDSDQDIIDSLEEAMKSGITKREWLSDLFHIGRSPSPADLVKRADVENALFQARLDFRLVQQIMDSLK